jgi:L-iditol 2-dehydrogenase
MVIGMGTPVQTLPISHAAHREVDLIGVFRYTKADYLAAIEYAAERPVLSTLVTHAFRGLDSVKGALDAAASPIDTAGNLVIKVMIRLEDEVKGQCIAT